MLPLYASQSLCFPMFHDPPVLEHGALPRDQELPDRLHDHRGIGFRDLKIGNSHDGLCAWMECAHSGNCGFVCIHHTEVYGTHAQRTLRNIVGDVETAAGFSVDEHAFDRLHAIG